MSPITEVADYVAKYWHEPMFKLLIIGDGTAVLLAIGTVLWLILTDRKAS